MNQQLDELLHKKMNRQDFLKHIGLGVLVVLGLGSILKLLEPTGPKKNPLLPIGKQPTDDQKINTSAGRAYGDGAYGA